nr:CBL-interacting serine/threonine-protein kinase 14-like [Ipomoea batatas]
MPEIPDGEEVGSTLSDSKLTLFDKYEMGKILGCGASAKVYHARVIPTGQNVAVKAISKQRIVKRGLTGNVMREISIMRRLRHPHIVRLHEVLATRTKVYTVMEYAKGGELFGKVAKGRFSEDLSRKYFQQLISAVDYCHARGVYHRDLKPENLLLDEKWDLKVTDFGLGAVKEQTRPDGRLHTLCGTPAYVAPEILTRKGYDGAKVDLWSCGVILFVLNASYLPFRDANLMAMYRKIYRAEFRVPKWTSPELKHLLTRILDANPLTRITIEGIKNDPWFRKGYKEVKTHSDSEPEFKPHPDFYGENNCFNAFDLISNSSGLNLSPIFDYPGGGSVVANRFLSAEPVERIGDTVEEIGRREGMRVTRKKGWVRVEGQNGDFTLVVETNRLTEKLVVVDVKRKQTMEESGQDVWIVKFKSRLSRLIYRPEEQVSGIS